jgi:hypothetical protein
MSAVIHGRSVAPTLQTAREFGTTSLSWRSTACRRSAPNRLPRAITHRPPRRQGPGSVGPAGRCASRSPQGEGTGCRRACLLASCLHRWCCATWPQRPNADNSTRSAYRRALVRLLYGQRRGQSGVGPRTKSREPQR